jgi:gluconate 2-dehydrogenase gamma chain
MGRLCSGVAAQLLAALVQPQGRDIMAKHDESRRKFLVGTAVGAGAAAGAALAPQALAKTAEHHGAQLAANEARDHAAMAPGMAPVMGGGHGAFFNDEDSRTVAAFAERLMPGAPGKPGATDANVLNYIDLALAGAYADEQDLYRRGLQALDAHCVAVHGKPFRSLAAVQQDEVIDVLQHGKSTAFTWPTAQAFFNTVRRHTLEGMFADPVYGGNKDFAGWQLVGFPGAQMMFTADDMMSKDAFTREPIVGLQSRLKGKKT